MLSDMFIHYDPNPRWTGRAGDCVIRALTLAVGKSWEEVYLELSMLGFRLGDMMSANHVWGEYLRGYGYRVRPLPDTCPVCYTVRDFAAEHPSGTYVLATGSHAVTVMNGDYYDTSDTGNEVPLFYYSRT